MPEALLSLSLTVAFVLPGFVIADLAESRRATRAARSDLELVLRGLVYALILQCVVALSGWTKHIVDDLSSASRLQAHLGQLSGFILIVGVLIPIGLGMALSAWLRRAEQRGHLRSWHYALGGRDYREAWDYVFGRRDGTYLLLTLSENGDVKHMLAKYGPHSWASQAPTRPPEIYVEEVWPADSSGMVADEILDRTPKRGMWISADKIARLEVLQPADAGSNG